MNSSALESRDLGLEITTLQKRHPACCSVTVLLRFYFTDFTEYITALYPSIIIRRDEQILPRARKLTSGRRLLQVKPASLWGLPAFLHHAYILKLSK